MAAENIDAKWPRHDLAQAFLSFNLLPSLTLHPSRVDPQMTAQWLPLLLGVGDALGLVAPSVLHRHWSRALISQFGLEPALGLEDPALPLAMAPASLFQRVSFLCGVALLAPMIRRSIDGQRVRELSLSLGDSALEFARHRCSFITQALVSGTDEPPLDRMVLCCTDWGNALLATVFSATKTKAVGQRGTLRLPNSTNTASLPCTDAHGFDTLMLARASLQFCDPVWLSSFPAAQ